MSLSGVSSLVVNRVRRAGAMTQQDATINLGFRRALGRQSGRPRRRRRDALARTQLRLRRSGLTAAGAGWESERRAWPQLSRFVRGAGSGALAEREYGLRGKRVDGVNVVA